jgi:hypothetical protein
MSDFGISNDGTPANGQGADEGRSAFNFEEGYNQLRPEYTRTTQQLSEAEQRLSEYEAFMEAISDPDTQAEALASLGFEMETGVTPEPEEFADPLEQEVQYLKGVVEQLQQGRELEAATQEESELLEMRDNYIGQTLDYIEQQTQTKFDEQDEEILGNLAIAMSDAEGVPDVQGAYNVLYGETGLLERQRAQWIESKTGAYTAPLGTSIPADKRPVTRADRIDFVDRRLQALDQLQQ